MSWPNRKFEKSDQRKWRGPRTDSEIFSICLEEIIFLCPLNFAGSEWSGSRLLSRSGFCFGRLVIETKSASVEKQCSLGAQAPHAMLASHIAQPCASLP